jgi:hypothetical protein
VSASNRAIRLRALVATLAIVLAPRAALACPVCFGDNDSPMAVAMNLGIFAMLIVVAGVLGAFATFFIYLIRRANQLERSAEAGATADAAEQKGTV